jgi:GNAT superfamily N-acetyltransferase
MRVIKLNKKYLQKAIDLTLKVFSDTKPEDFDYPPKWLRYSLENQMPYVSSLGYFIAVEKEKVIGITGLYELPEDKKEASWVAWFCIDPKARGKGLGNKLLNLMIEKAKKSGKKYLRLYTSSGPVEEIARNLYNKKGFIETKREKGKNYDKIYMELKLIGGLNKYEKEKV